MTDTCVDGKVHRIQAMLYAKASHEPELRFSDLYKYLTRHEWIETAIDRVLRNRGSRTPGVDGITRRDLLDGETRARLSTSVREDLKHHTYQPQPARRVTIPKPNGKQRPLGILTLKDRVVQQVVKMAIEPIFEARFLPCSYGFRPNRCTWDALAETYQYLKSHCHYYTVIEGDIRNCFGTINHQRLMEQLQRSLQDKRLLTLLWKMLRAGVMDDLQYFETTEGSPQGGLISPLLANVYMHQLDEWFHTRFHARTPFERWKRGHAGEVVHVRYIRYADDFVILMRGTEDQAVTLKHELTTYINEELKMTLSEEKTLITQATDGFDFLGVHTFVGPQRSNPTKLMPYQIPAKASVDSYKRRVRMLTAARSDYINPAERIIALNWLIEGWANYHRWGNAKATFSALSSWTIRKVHRMLQRYTPHGKRTTYKEYFRPVAECDNLHKWRRYTVWKTPSVSVGDNSRVGILPMAVISTGRYWTYRGSKIPNAFPLLDTMAHGIPRDTGFHTAEAVIALVRVVPKKTTERYDALYFLRRKEVFRRDHYTCTTCGYRSQRQKGDVHDLECHHITPHKGNQLINLRTVCKPCHLMLTIQARS